MKRRRRILTDLGELVLRIAGATALGLIAIWLATRIG